MKDYIELKNVYKTYKIGSVATQALSGINLTIENGSIVVFLGPSGSGKTTLLNCISGLDNPTKGTIKVGDTIITKLNESKLTKFRKEKLGFIFQTYNLLEHLNVYENILIGASLGNSDIDINKVIDTVKLTKHKKKYMYELSGGEQQRVSIARAIAKNPEIMFCDEPTGALDEETGKEVLDALVKINDEYKTTMIIITHNPGIALIGDRILKLNSGKIISDEKNKRISPKDIPWG